MCKEKINLIKQIGEQLAQLYNTINDDKAFSANSDVMALKKKKTELEQLTDKLTPIVLENKIETLSQNKSFVKHVGKHSQKDSLEALKVFIESFVAKTNQMQKI